MLFRSWGAVPSFTVGGVTKSITRTNDWSSLSEGAQYVSFNTVADSLGTISFTPQPNPTNTTNGASEWSAFQLREAQPVPGPLPILGVAAAFRSMRKLSKLRSVSSALQQG